MASKLMGSLSKAPSSLRPRSYVGEVHRLCSNSAEEVLNLGRCALWCSGSCCSTERCNCCQKRHACTCTLPTVLRQSLPPELPSQALTFGAVKPGYCAPVKYNGSCNLDSIGYWDAGGQIHSLLSCAERCLACDRCAYISFSVVQRICSWHSQCDMSDLRRSQSGVDFRSVAVRTPRPSRPPRMPRPGLRSGLQLGIVTLVAGGSMRCGLVHWCERAQAMSEGLPDKWNVTIGVLGDPFDAADCPRAVAIRIAPALKESLHRCPEADGRVLHGKRIREVNLDH